MCIRLMSRLFLLTVVSGLLGLGLPATAGAAGPWKSALRIESLGIFYGGVSLLWATLVGGAGVASLYAYANNRENWWALIPGTTLVAIAFNIVLSVESILNIILA